MKFTKLLLATSLLIPFAACGSDEKAAQEKEQAAAQQQAPAQQPPAQQPPQQNTQPQTQGYSQQPSAPAEYPAEPTVKAPAQSKPRPAPAKSRTRTPQRTQEPSYEPQPAPAGDVAENRSGQDDTVVMPSPRRRVDDGSGMDTAPRAPAAPLPPPAPTTALLKEGSVLDIRLLDEISTARDKQGDTFSAVLDRDLEVDGKLVAPKGSKVTGKLTEVVSAGKVKGLARLSMVLSSMVVESERYSLETNPISIEAENTKARDAKTVGAGAGIGAVIGAIAGGKKGAAIGAAVGGGAGGAGVLLTKGKEIEFQPEHKFSFRLEKDIEMKIQ